MTLDRRTLRELLPCYVCGDLPEPIAAQVRELLARDAELAAEARNLEGAQDACRELLLGMADELPDLAALVVAPVLDPPRAPAAPVRGGWALVAAAVGLLFVLGGVGILSRHPPVDGLLAQHAPFAAGQVDGFIAESDPDALAAALVRAGALPELGAVPDLRPLGLHLLGGGLATGDRPGTVVVYEKDGQRFVCQMFPGSAPRDMPVATRRVAGRTLRAYVDGDLAVVVWREAGMVCLFSGRAPPETLLAMVQAKLEFRA
ncbi:MAG: hypothetical protein D6798_20715 [Deltaproteobacteria bacterium]|nr:MAG: hypothetical protein D6798_20715 [Deltaproteobacteria bacterium]